MCLNLLTAIKLKTAEISISVEQIFDNNAHQNHRTSSTTAYTFQSSLGGVNRIITNSGKIVRKLRKAKL